MEDRQIIKLYWDRAEEAIRETAAKRSPEAMCSLEELGDCVSGRTGVEDELENRRIEEAIDAFLWLLDKEKRTLFIRHYFWWTGFCRTDRKIPDSR